MRLAGALILVFVAGCPQQGGDDYPIGPGGGSGGMGGTGKQDAGFGDANDGGTLVAGRVCEVTDLRKLDVCLESGLGGLQVTLGSAVAVTRIDGTFEITAPNATNLAWHVTGDNIVPSIKLVSLVNQIPVINDEKYNQLLTGNSVLLQSGQGTLVAQLTHGSLAATGATVTLAPATANETFYDGASALVWDTDSAGIEGVTWLPGADVGTAVITSTLGTGQIVNMYPIEDQAITFAEIEIP